MSNAIEQIAITALTPYDRNARTHSPAQVQQIAASISEFGFVNPVLIDKSGMIIAGHGRVMAATKLGLEEVPCLRVDGLTEAQIRAYILADNQLALNSGWDQDLLRGELAALQGFDFDLDLLGFSTDALAAMLADQTGSGHCDPDEVPPPPLQAMTVPGDLWILGEHRLLCGDSTDQTAVARLLGDTTPHLMVTDPPYGVEYDASWREKIGLSSKQTAKGKVLNDNNADWTSAWILFPGDVAYIWHAGSMADIVVQSLKAAGFIIYAQIIWAKDNIVIGRGHYHYQHEPCWYAVRKGRTGHWQGSRKQKTVWRLVGEQVREDELVFVRADQSTEVLALSGDESTIWEIPKPLKSETGHSTQKPVECMARPIRNNSRRGDTVYEPFSGSGTTIIAAEQNGRRCFAMELSPRYVDIAVLRWQNFTGRKAHKDV